MCGIQTSVPVSRLQPPSTLPPTAAGFSPIERDAGAAAGLIGPRWFRRTQSPSDKLWRPIRHTTRKVCPVRVTSTSPV